VIDASKGGTLDINFIAYDPDGHLAYYTVEAHFGNNRFVDLLTVPGATLTPAPAAGPAPSAAQVGPTYADAMNAASPLIIAPVWAGGSIKLHIPNLRDAFPETCCYQLKLSAYKRTIVNCYGGAAHNNTSEYSLTVIV
jgi:hypothetical protein